MKLIDELGKRYGKLTVVARAENQGTRAAWLCKCDCGKERIVLGKLLREGKVKSCGCLKREVLIERNTKNCDLIGKRFGKLVVIKENGTLAKTSGKNVRLWLCKCDCGNFCEIQTQYLQNGDTASCGCSHSRGEAAIIRKLNLLNIIYETEYIIKDFKYPSGGTPRFDFAIFDNDNNLLCLIEFQGSIHFKAYGTGWNTEEALEQRKINDELKRKYCKENNIRLYEITYLDNIEEKLEEIINGQYE